MHSPSQHVCPTSHSMPQSPQLSWSVTVSTHWPPQHNGLSSPQTFLQVPHWLSCEFRSKHSPRTRLTRIARRAARTAVDWICVQIGALTAAAIQRNTWGVDRTLLADRAADAAIGCVSLEIEAHAVATHIRAVAPNAAAPTIRLILCYACETATQLSPSASGSALK